MKRYITSFALLIATGNIYCMQGAQSGSPSAQDTTCAAFIPYVQKALEHIKAAPHPKPLEECTTLAECIAAYNPHPEYLSDFIGYLRKHTDEPVYGGPNKVTPAMAGPYVFWSEFLNIRGLLAYHQNRTNPHVQPCATISRILSEPENKGISAAAVAYKKIAKLNKWYVNLDKDVTSLSKVQPPLAKDIVQKIVHERDSIKQVLDTALRLLITQNATQAQASTDTQETLSPSPFRSILSKWIGAGIVASSFIILICSSPMPQEAHAQQVLSVSQVENPNSMILPRIKQALGDLLLPCDQDDYSAGCARN